MLFNNRKLIRFHKICVSGNDFIVLNGIKLKYDLNCKKIQNLCDRNYGIGADQLLIIKKSSEVAVFELVIYNQNGSQAYQCGNGICAVAYYLMVLKKYCSSVIYIKTKFHQYKCRLKKFNSVEVEFHSISTKNTRLHIKKEFFDYGVEVSMGNQHLILFSKIISEKKLYSYGELIQKKYCHDLNINFVKVIDRKNITILHWERGAGATLSCGSGTVASVCAGYKLGLLDSNINIYTNNKKNQINVKVCREKYYLKTKPFLVFNGSLRINNEYTLFET